MIWRQIRTRDAHPELVSKAKSQVPANVKFYADYIPMLDVLRGHKLSLHHSPEWMVKGLMLPQDDLLRRIGCEPL